MVSPEIEKYLYDVRSHLRLDSVTEKQVIDELCTYFQEKLAELRQRGVPESAASRMAIESCGRARVVARLMYEAYSKGSWHDVVMASLPHLVIAGMFVSHLWDHLPAAPLFLIAVACVTFFGWWHGKPNWLYSWIGYSLIPVVVSGYMSFPAFRQTISSLLEGEGVPIVLTLLLALLCALFIFLVWIIIRAVVRAVKRDWILASLMLLPLPVLGSWLFNIEQHGGLLSTNRIALHQWDASMALAFAVLGATAATFIRVRQRFLKIAAVVAVGSIVFTAVGSNLLGFFYPPALFILMLIFLVAPALLEARLGHGESEENGELLPDRKLITR